MKKWILSSLLVGLSLQGISAQNKVLTLEALRSQAIEHYPTNRQKALFQATLQVSKELLDRNLFPQVSLTGLASYQSEVTKFDIPGGTSFGIPEQKPDQYRIGLDLRYNLTDFGALEAQSRLLEQNTQAQLLQADISIQRLKEQLDGLYGSVLLVQQNKHLVQLRLQDLEARMRKVESAVRNGSSLRSNLLVLQSEQQVSLQRVDELNSQLLTLTESIQILSGITVDTSYQFELPQAIAAVEGAANRPETQLFSVRKQGSDLQGELLRQRNRPQVFLFGQGNYGRPGYNFLNNDMRLYGIAGLGLNWNLNNEANQKLQLQILSLQQQQVSEEENLFNEQLAITTSQERNEILRYQTIIQRDSAIVSARESIVHAAQSQLDNGAITATEYLTELNALYTARLNETLHQVQWVMALQQLRTTLGN